MLLLLACTTADSADADTTTKADCAPAADFPTLTADPANSAYEAPSVEASCEGDELVVQSNDIPWFEFVPLTPNALNAQAFEWRVPLTPTPAAEPVSLNLLGADAFSLVGLPMYTPNEAQEPDPYGDPVYNEIVDHCYGHTGGAGDYHFHALDVECATTQAPAAGPSPLLGYALDGYPVYGPYGCLDADCTEVVEFVSGWEQTGDPSTYAWDAYAYVGGGDATILDPCNGRTEPDGSYAYHATSGFPYVVGCYHGEVSFSTDTEPVEDTGPGQEVIDCADAEPGKPCCGDDVCDGPETADNCAVDCA